MIPHGEPSPVLWLWLLCTGRFRGIGIKIFDVIGFQLPVPDRHGISKELCRVSGIDLVLRRPADDHIESLIGSQLYRGKIEVFVAGSIFFAAVEHVFADQADLFDLGPGKFSAFHGEKSQPDLLLIDVYDAGTVHEDDEE